jgi:hypothetical protein
MDLWYGRGREASEGILRQLNVRIDGNLTLVAEDAHMKGCRPLTETEVA